MSQHKLKVGHVGLNVSNIETSVIFYTNVLGFNLLGKSTENGKNYAFLGNDKQLLLTLWEQSKGGFSTTTPGLHHLAIEVETIELLKSYEERLKNNLVKFIYDGLVSHAEGSASGGIYFKDPDGIRLEICVSQGMEAHSPVAEKSCGFF